MREIASELSTGSETKAVRDMPGILAENLCVEFPVVGASRSFRNELLRGKVGGFFGKSTSAGNSPNVVVRGLQNLSFELRQGDRLGLIGHNGAGKSTLLRTLAGCYAPTSGTLDVTGKVVPMLSLGAGIDGDFSGYENITLFGLHLGMTRAEIDERTREIAEFTELGEFLKLPIRTYSSGMLLRLTFGVATSLNPEILLVDEIFGAGDSRFYQKAKKRMEDLLERSSLLVFASHNTALLGEYCNLGGVFENGQCQFIGPIVDALEFYRRHGGSVA